MTSSEIIKALECIGSDKDIPCKDCLYNKYDFRNCHRQCAKDAISLINQQKLEIEQWKEEANKYQNLWCKAVENFEILERTIQDRLAALSFTDHKNN